MGERYVKKHGYSCYRNRGCRCEICCAAAARLRKRYRKKSDNYWGRISAQPLIDKLEESEQLSFIKATLINSWTERGIDVYQADKWCVKFGWHPVEVFGSQFYVGCFDNEIEGK